jgi:hypothetical protein
MFCLYVSIGDDRAKATTLEKIIRSSSFNISFKDDFIIYFKMQAVWGRDEWDDVDDDDGCYIDISGEFY